PHRAPRHLHRFAHRRRASPPRPGLADSRGPLGDGLPRVGLSGLEARPARARGPARPLGFGRRASGQPRLRVPDRRADGDRPAELVRVDGGLRLARLLAVAVVDEPTSARGRRTGLVQAPALQRRALLLGRAHLLELGGTPLDARLALLPRRVALELAVENAEIRRGARRL